jgi:hypothetical protein
MKKDRLILLVVGILSAIGIIAAVISSGTDSAVPMSAEGMSVEDRDLNDSSVLKEELAEFDIDRVSVNYSGDVISIYINRESTEQYIEDYANDVIAAVKSALQERKEDMTLEKETYSVMIYGNDGLIKVAST